MATTNVSISDATNNEEYQKLKKQVLSDRAVKSGKTSKAPKEILDKDNQGQTKGLQQEKGIDRLKKLNQLVNNAPPAMKKRFEEAFTALNKTGIKLNPESAKEYGNFKPELTPAKSKSSKKGKGSRGA